MIRSLEKQRVLIGVLLLVSVFVLPSLFTMFLGAIMSLRYARYFEFPIASLLIDALYGPTGHATIGLFGFALVYILIVDYVRIRIRMRDNRKLY